jgi:hypothetical protein
MATAAEATVAPLPSPLSPLMAGLAAVQAPPADGAVATVQGRQCARCGAEIIRRRRTAKQNQALCAACDQRERRAAYFRTYYEEHKDRILDKNRRWARDNKSRIVQLRQARRTKTIEGAEGKRCIDCDTPVTRAERCRKCYIRFRYATDPNYRARRLATTRRWLDRRQRDPALLARRPSTRPRTTATQAFAN